MPVKWKDYVNRFTQVNEYTGISEDIVDSIGSNGWWDAPNPVNRITLSIIQKEGNYYTTAMLVAHSVIIVDDIVPIGTHTMDSMKALLELQALAKGIAWYNNSAYSPDPITSC